MKLCITRELLERISSHVLGSNFDYKTEIEYEHTCYAACFGNGHSFELWYTVGPASNHDLYSYQTENTTLPVVHAYLTLYAHSDGDIKELRRLNRRKFDHLSCSNLIEYKCHSLSCYAAELRLFSTCYSESWGDISWDDEDSTIFRILFYYTCDGVDGLYDNRSLECFFTVVDSQDDIPKDTAEEYVFLRPVIDLKSE